MSTYTSKPFSVLLTQAWSLLLRGTSSRTRARTRGWSTAQSAGSCLRRVGLRTLAVRVAAADGGVT